ncbi:hypothetical protein FQN60_000346, partial [Etheostoma spectabile]
MTWPLSSPDLNPIENWGLLKREIYSEGRQFTSLKSIWEALVVAAQKVDHQQIKKLTDSMAGRLITVIIKQKGGYIVREHPEESVNGALLTPTYPVILYMLLSQEPLHPEYPLLPDSITKESLYTDEVWFLAAALIQSEEQPWCGSMWLRWQLDLYHSPEPGQWVSCCPLQPQIKTKGLMMFFHSPTALRLQ